MDATPMQLLEALANDPVVREDPYPLYRNARAMGEVLSLGNGFFVASGYRAAETVLRSPKFQKVPPDGATRRRSVFDPDYPTSMLFLDPPEHSRLRRAVAGYFVPSQVSAMLTAIGDCAKDLVGSLVAKGGGDFVEEVSAKLPIRVISSMLGVPSKEGEALRASVAIVARSLDLGSEFDPVSSSELAVAGAELLGYFSDLIAQDSSGATMLARMQHGSDPLSAKESAVMALLLFMAGFETTANLISSMIFMISTDDGIAAQVNAREADIPALVEEFLRLEAPVQLDGRVAGGDLDLAGVRVPRGSFVMTLIGAANRDAEIFANPDQFLPSRRDATVLSFGAGIHHCLGAALARAEARAVLSCVRELGRPRLVSARRKPSLTLRGFESLVVEV